MKRLCFLPWVGSNYAKGINGNKIMILGESHYCESIDDATENMTHTIIEDLYDEASEHEPYKNTYTKFERAIVGHNLSFAEKKNLWNSVMFYNFVQKPMSGPRVRPSSSDFSESSDFFMEVLDKYQPDFVLVWGNDLYNNLPRKGYQLDDLEIDNGDSFEVWCYELNSGHRVKVLKTTHPSAAFQPDYWHKVIKEFIK